MPNHYPVILFRAYFQERGDKGELTFTGITNLPFPSTTTGLGGEEFSLEKTLRYVIKLIQLSTKHITPLY